MDSIRSATTYERLRYWFTWMLFWAFFDQVVGYIASGNHERAGHDVFILALLVIGGMISDWILIRGLDAIEARKAAKNVL